MNISVLILSGLYDFSTDLVVQELEKKGISYLRLNKEMFSDYRLTLDIGQETLKIEIGSSTYTVNQDVQAIYYRQPVFLRNSPGDPLSVEDQLYRSQWMGFLRSLLVFDKTKWVNHPKSTYEAETKAYQLKVAKDIGFNIPDTVIGNDSDKFNRFGNSAIIKSLDTVLLRDQDECLFTYSTISDAESLLDEEVRSSPLTVQEYIYPKIDLRVTVIEDKIYGVQILSNGKGIDEDWRIIDKSKIEYVDINLPQHIKSMCFQLMDKLDLAFAAIDFILRDNEYIFIEINPTGEWGWLVKDDRRIDVDMAKILIGEESNDRIAI